MQVKQNRLDFDRVLLQGGKGRVCTVQRRVGDLINMDEKKIIINKYGQRGHNTAQVALKYGRLVVLDDVGEFVQDG